MFGVFEVHVFWKGVLRTGFSRFMFVEVRVILLSVRGFRGSGFKVRGFVIRVFLQVRGFEYGVSGMRLPIRGFAIRSFRYGVLGLGFRGPGFGVLEVPDFAV